MTGAQEQAVGRLRKDKKKSNVKIRGTVGDEVQMEWTEKTPLDEDRKVLATIQPNGRVIEAL